MVETTLVVETTVVVETTMYWWWKQLMVETTEVETTVVETNSGGKHTSRQITRAWQNKLRVLCRTVRRETTLN